MKLIYFGPEELNQEEVELCLNEALKLWELIHAHPSPQVHSLTVLFERMVEIRPITAYWELSDIEVFRSLGPNTLTSLFQRLHKMWPELPSYDAPGEHYSRTVVYNCMTEQGVPTQGGLPLYWAHRLGLLERLGIRAVLPRSNPKPDVAILSNEGVMASEGILRTHECKAELDKELGIDKGLERLEKAGTPKGGEVTVRFTMVPMRVGYEVKSSAFVKKDGKVIDQTNNLPGYPPTEIILYNEAMLHAKHQAKKLASELRGQECNVTRIEVITPDAECIKIPLVDKVTAKDIKILTGRQVEVDVSVVTMAEGYQLRAALRVNDYDEAGKFSHVDVTPEFHLYDDRAEAIKDAKELAEKLRKKCEDEGDSVTKAQVILPSDKRVSVFHAP